MKKVEQHCGACGYTYKDCQCSGGSTDDFAESVRSTISRAVSMMVVLGVSIGVGTVALAAFLLGVGAIAAVIIVVMLAPFILLFRWLA